MPLLGILFTVVVHGLDEDQMYFTNSGVNSELFGGRPYPMAMDSRFVESSSPDGPVWNLRGPEETRRFRISSPYYSPRGYADWSLDDLKNLNAKRTGKNICKTFLETHSF